MSDLKDKVAIVTGAGRGIGEAIALALGKAGAKVIVASRTPATVKAVTKAIRDAGGEATEFIVDVGEREQVYSMVDHAVKAYGTVDILVNNAQGFGTRDKPEATIIHAAVEDTDEAELEYSFRTGFHGTFWAMRAAFPYLKAQGGSVINFSSTAGQVGNEESTSYNVTKEAVRALSKTAANEWGKYDITVNIINPMLYSDAYKAFGKKWPDQLKEHLRQIPMGGRLGDVKEAGNLIVFLAGDGARYITGMTFYLDGGHDRGR